MLTKVWLDVPAAPSGLRFQVRYPDVNIETEAQCKRCSAPTFRDVFGCEIPHGMISMREFLHGRSNGASHKQRGTASQPAMAR